jgi:hypothetical protein
MPVPAGTQACRTPVYPHRARAREVRATQPGLSTARDGYLGIDVVIGWYTSPGGKDEPTRAKACADPRTGQEWLDVETDGGSGAVMRFQAPTARRGLLKDSNESFNGSVMNLLVQRAAGTPDRFGHRGHGECPYRILTREAARVAKMKPEGLKTAARVDVLAPASRRSWDPTLAMLIEDTLAGAA